jgi:membrane protease YdiL (CAAX protease family)
VDRAERTAGQQPMVRVERRGVRWLFCGPRGLRSGWRLLAYIGLVALFAFALAHLVSLIPHRALHGPGMHPASLLWQESVLAGAVLLAAGVMALAERRGFAAYGLPPRGLLGGLFWEGTLWGVAALAVLMSLLAAVGVYRFTSGNVHGREALEAALLWAAAFFLVGLFEEFFFRGYALATLAEGIGFWPAAVSLALLFGAVHLRNTGESLRGAALAALVAVVFSLSLRRTGSLWFAIGFHAAWDWSQTFLFGVPDSGQPSALHWLTGTPAGPDWVSGGSAGPEGSVLALVVVALAAYAIHRRFPQIHFGREATLT